MGRVLCECQGIRLRSKNKNLKTGTFLELCKGRSPELRGVGGLGPERRACVFSVTKLGDSVHTLKKQNQVNNGMDLIYLKQYFSPFSN